MPELWENGNTPEGCALLPAEMSWLWQQHDQGPIDTMMDYRHLFGPVPSRRFGRSLGVDLTPYKTCSFDCIFCQLGRTTNKTVARREYVPTGEVIDELGDWLKSGSSADYITLSGSGEPTLHSGFGDILEFIRGTGTVPAVLLTNGTMFYLPEVRNAAVLANVVKVSLSAWDQLSFEQINRPDGALTLEGVVEGIRSFRSEFTGKLWVEVFFVQKTNTARADASGIADLVKTIGPDRVHINTAVRPASEQCVVSVPRKDLKELTALFDPPAEVIAEFSSGISKFTEATESDILAMLQRRPCTMEQIGQVFAMHRNEVSKYVGKLTREGRIQKQTRGENTYYMGSLETDCLLKP